MRAFGLTFNEITQVTWITHVTVPNFLKRKYFLKNHRSYTNHTSLLEYQYETFGLPYDEIKQVTWITHIPNLLKMKIFWEITEVTPTCSSFGHKIKKSHCRCDNAVSKFHFHPFSRLKRWLIRNHNVTVITMCQSCTFVHIAVWCYCY